MPTWISKNQLILLNLPERLRGLPDFDPPAGGWTRLSERKQARRRHWVTAGSGFALAASVLVAVGLFNLLPPFTGGGREGSAPPPQSYPASGGGSYEVAQLINRSQRLEHRLSQARQQVAVWDTRRASRAALLERALARVDAELDFPSTNDGADSTERLWSDRVELMNALVDLHQPEAPALQYASYQY